MSDQREMQIARDTPDRVSIDRARSLRANAPIPERVLWNRVRAGRLNGLKFRRQQPMLGYTLDFYCHDASLAVEIDGEMHGMRRSRDARRDAFLAQHGVATLRVPASEVSTDVERVLGWILHAARKRLDMPKSPHPAAPPPPSPVGEGGNDPRADSLHSPP